MTSKAQLLQLIARAAREVLPELQAHEFIASDSLSDLGANSVDRVEIVMLVQEALNLSVPRVELFGSGNIGELADLLVKKLHAA